MNQAEINRIYKIVLEGYKRNYPKETITEEFKEKLFNSIVNNL